MDSCFGCDFGRGRFVGVSGLHLHSLPSILEFNKCLKH